MTRRGLQIRPMPIGAEVGQLAEGDYADPEVQEALYQAWLEHGVLLFRDIASTEQHLSLSRCFGELEIHPVVEQRSDEHPLLIELGGQKRSHAYVFDERDVRINRIAWHRDTAYTPDICKGAMLRMVDVPGSEGETMVADTARAYDDLPLDMKQRLAGLEFKATLRLDPPEIQSQPGAFWKSARLATAIEDPEGPEPKPPGNETTAERWPSVVHPAVLQHPETGRMSIFLSPTYVDHFLGMDEQEGSALLRYLADHMLQPKYIYKHCWARNDALLWDNRRFLHAGMGNSVDEPRRGLRTTLAGPVRTGRYFDTSAVPSGPILAD